MTELEICENVVHVSVSTQRVVPQHHCAEHKKKYIKSFKTIV